MKMNKRFIFLALFSVLSLQTVCYGMFPSFPDSQPNCFQKTTLEVLLEDKKFEWSTRWDSLRRQQLPLKVFRNDKKILALQE